MFVVIVDKINNNSLIFVYVTMIHNFLNAVDYVVNQSTFKTSIDQID